MKRIGIVTFYFADNYGAVLQSYALKKAIDGLNSDVEAELVPFVPDIYISAKCRGKGFSYPLHIKKRQDFYRFLVERCGLIQRESLSEITGNFYDAYCVGSDQVWNKSCMDTKEYFLPNLAPDAIRFSYAASLGVDANDPMLDIETMKQQLPLFQKLSVREYEHVEMIEKISGKECECVLDPTLLLNKEDYEEILCDCKPEKEAYLFFYWLSFFSEKQRIVMQLVDEIADKYGLKIIHNLTDDLGYSFRNDARSMGYEGVENFVNYIKNADFIITNSYHGTIFSIIYQRPFYTFPNSNRRTRIDTLVKRFGIGERVLDEIPNIEDINKNIEYVSIKQRIDEGQKESYKYLRGAVGLVINRPEKDAPKSYAVGESSLYDAHKYLFYYDVSDVNNVEEKIFSQEFVRVHQQWLILKYLELKQKGRPLVEFFKQQQKKHIALYAVTDVTKAVLPELIEENKNLCIVDKMHYKYVQGICGIPVIGKDDLVLKYKAGEIDAVAICNLYRMSEIYKELIDVGICKEDIFLVPEILYELAEKIN